MMTEIKAIEGGQKRCSPWEGQHKKNPNQNYVNLMFILTFIVFTC
jgi:hypothetical protein